MNKIKVLAYLPRIDGDQEVKSQISNLINHFNLIKNFYTIALESKVFQSSYSLRELFTATQSYEVLFLSLILIFMNRNN